MGVAHTPLYNIPIKLAKDNLRPLSSFQNGGLSDREAVPQRCHVAPQCPAKLDQRDDREVVLAPLDPPHITAIKCCGMCKLFLRHAELPPSFADTLTKDVDMWITHSVNSRMR